MKKEITYWKKGRLKHYGRIWRQCVKRGRQLCGTGGRSGVDARLYMVVGFEDPFALVAVMREIPSVKPTITVGFDGVVFGRKSRGSVRC